VASALRVMSGVTSDVAWDASSCSGSGAGGEVELSLPAPSAIVEDLRVRNA